MILLLPNKFYHQQYLSDFQGWTHSGIVVGVFSVIAGGKPRDRGIRYPRFYGRRQVVRLGRAQFAAWREWMG